MLSDFVCRCLSADVSDPRLYRGGNRPRSVTEVAVEEEAVAGNCKRGGGGGGGEWKAVVLERRHFPNGEVRVAGIPGLVWRAACECFQLCH